MSSDEHSDRRLEEEEPSSPKSTLSPSPVPVGPANSTTVTNPNLSRLANETFNSFQQYIEKEFELNSQKIQLIDDLNTSCTRKYSEWTQLIDPLKSSFDQLNDKYKNILLHFNQVDDIIDQIAKLERFVANLNNFTCQLEEKLKL